MTKSEVKKIISYLFAAYPNAKWGDDDHSASATAKIWEDAMTAFPYDVAQESCRLWLFDGNKFFPNIAEFIKVCDHAWQRREEKNRGENTKSELLAANFLFHNPTENIKDYYVKKSVELVRDVTDGKIRFMSQEWIDRFNDIYGGEYDPHTGRDYII